MSNAEDEIENGLRKLRLGFLHRRRCVTITTRSPAVEAMRESFENSVEGSLRYYLHFALHSLAESHCRAS